VIAVAAVHPFARALAEGGPQRVSASTPVSASAKLLTLSRNRSDPASESCLRTQPRGSVSASAAGSSSIPLGSVTVEEGAVVTSSSRRPLRSALRCRSPPLSAEGEGVYDALVMSQPSSRRALGVAFLTDSTSFPGGLADSMRLRLLARALVEQGAEANVFCVRAIDRPPAVENARAKGTWNGVSFEYTPGSSIRPSSFAMRRWLELRGWAVAAIRLIQSRRQGRLDCVFTACPSDELTFGRELGLAFGRLVRRPVFIQLNERPWTTKARPRRLERWLSPLWGVQGVVSISQYLSDWTRSERERLGQHVVLVEIPIVVDVGEQGTSEYPNGAPSVLFAGSPVYDATIDFILTAMKTVWEEHPACRLTITGVNPERPQSAWLMERLRDGELDLRVDVVGYLSRDDLLAAYSRSHALLIPLFDDVRSKARFPTKLGEYLASGRPVVTTSVGEVRRFMSDGVDAYITPPDDPVAYGQRICDVLSDCSAASQVGRAGRQLAETRFHYSIHGPALVEAIETACAGR